MRIGHLMCSSGSPRLERQRWIEAGNRLAIDRDAKVSCPRCDGTYLEITDVPWKDGVHLDRYMQCPQCGARNVLTRFVEEETS